MIKKEMTKFGLLKKDLEKVINTIRINNKEIKIIIFGSRAKGNFKSNSDIDLAIKSQDEISYGDLNKIRYDLDELLLPFTIDLIDFNKIENQDLINHIERVGVEL